MLFRFEMFRSISEVIKFPVLCEMGFCGLCFVIIIEVLMAWFFEILALFNFLDVVDEKWIIVVFHFLS